MFYFSKKAKKRLNRLLLRSGIITSFDLEVGESEALEPSPQLDLQEFSELDIQENADSTLEISENQLDNNDVAKKEPDSLQIVGDDLVASQQLDQSIQEESNLRQTDVVEVYEEAKELNDVLALLTQIPQIDVIANQLNDVLEPIRRDLGPETPSSSLVLALLTEPTYKDLKETYLKKISSCISQIPEILAELESQGVTDQGEILGMSTLDRLEKVGARVLEQEKFEQYLLVSTLETVNRMAIASKFTSNVQQQLQNQLGSEFAGSDVSEEFLKEISQGLLLSRVASSMADFFTTSSGSSSQISSTRTSETTVMSEEFSNLGDSTVLEVSADEITQALEDLANGKIEKLPRAVASQLKEGSVDAVYTKKGSNCLIETLKIQKGKDHDPFCIEATYLPLANGEWLLSSFSKEQSPYDKFQNPSKIASLDYSITVGMTTGQDEASGSQKGGLLTAPLGQDKASGSQGPAAASPGAPTDAEKPETGSGSESSENSDSAVLVAGNPLNVNSLAKIQRGFLTAGVNDTDSSKIVTIFKNDSLRSENPLQEFYDRLQLDAIFCSLPIVKGFLNSNLPLFQDFNAMQNFITQLEDNGILALNEPQKNELNDYVRAHFSRQAVQQGNSYFVRSQNSSLLKSEPFGDLQKQVLALNLKTKEQNFLSKVILGLDTAQFFSHNPVCGNVFISSLRFIYTQENLKKQIPEVVKMFYEVGNKAPTLLVPPPSYIPNQFLGELLAFQMTEGKTTLSFDFNNWPPDLLDTVAGFCPTLLVPNAIKPPQPDEVLREIQLAQIAEIRTQIFDPDHLRAISETDTLARLNNSLKLIPNTTKNGVQRALGQKPVSASKTLIFGGDKYFVQNLVAKLSTEQSGTLRHGVTTLLRRSGFSTYEKASFCVALIREVESLFNEVLKKAIDKNAGEALSPEILVSYERTRKISRDCDDYEKIFSGVAKLITIISDTCDKEYPNFFQTALDNVGSLENWCQTRKVLSIRAEGQINQVISLELSVETEQKNRADAEAELQLKYGKLEIRHLARVFAQTTLQQKLLLAQRTDQQTAISTLVQNIKRTPSKQVTLLLQQLLDKAQYLKDYKAQKNSKRFLGVAAAITVASVGGGIYWWHKKGFQNQARQALEQFITREKEAKNIQRAANLFIREALRHDVEIDRNNPSKMFLQFVMGGRGFPKPENIFGNLSQIELDKLKSEWQTEGYYDFVTKNPSAGVYEALNNAKQAYPACSLDGPYVSAFLNVFACSDDFAHKKSEFLALQSKPAVPIDDFIVNLESIIQTTTALVATTYLPKSAAEITEKSPIKQSTGLAAGLIVGLSIYKQMKKNPFTGGAALAIQALPFIAGVINKHQQEKRTSEL